MDPFVKIPEITFGPDYPQNVEELPEIDKSFVKYFQDISDDTLLLLGKASEHLQYSDLKNMVNYTVAIRNISKEEFKKNWRQH